MADPVAPTTCAECRGPAGYAYTCVLCRGAICGKCIEHPIGRCCPARNRDALTKPWMRAVRWKRYEATLIDALPENYDVFGLP